MTLTLERSWFITNSAGEDEFDYVLGQLGVPEEKRDDIDTVEFDCVTESDFELS